MSSLIYSNGFNSVFNSPQLRTPNRVYVTGFTPSILANLNCMLLFFFIPPVLAIIFHKVHDINMNWRFRLRRAWKLVLGEYNYTIVLFTLLNFSTSLGMFLVYSSVTSWQFYVSVVELLVYGGILGIMIWMFVTKNKKWMGEYKYLFNWNKFCELYYLFPTVEKFLVGLVLGTMNMTFAAGIICTLLLAVSPIVVAVKKPYIEQKHNVRSILTSAYGILILIVYTVMSYKGPSTEESLFLYLPYAVLVILGLNALTGLGYVIATFVRDKRIADQNKIQ